MIPVGKFGGGIATRQISRWEFELLEPLQFMDKQHGMREIPVGFVSDLASIRILREIARWSAIAAVIGAAFSIEWPWLTASLWAITLVFLALYSLTTGYNMRSSFMHDWEYTAGELSRKDVDALYWRAQHTGDGTAAWRSWIFWLGVRLGGGRRYCKR